MVEDAGADAPLAGIRVIELCQNVAGPYAGLILAQLGAEVVKVERPELGDDTRQWGPPFWGGESVMFATMNAGKASRTIDIDTDEDRAALLELVDSADVLLAAWRPGSLERRGFGFADLYSRNEQLIYCSISGFGDRGPLAERPGYDPLVQGFSGMMAITGQPGGEPVRAGTSMMDMGTGMWAALAVVSALRRRDRTGRGALLTTSLFETGLAWLPYQLTGYLATGEEPQKLGSGLAMLVPYQAFETADRPLVVSAGNDTLWQRLCSVLDRPDLVDDPELATNPGRVANRERVVGALQETFRTRDADHWDSALQEAGIPCAVVQSLGEVAAHPQTEAVEMLHPLEHDRIDGFAMPALPLRIDGWRPVPRSGPPALGDADPSTERSGPK